MTAVAVTTRHAWFLDAIGVVASFFVICLTSLLGTSDALQGIDLAGLGLMTMTATLVFHAFPLVVGTYVCTCLATSSTCTSRFLDFVPTDKFAAS